MQALLIIDMQVGCVAGATPRAEVENVVSRINALAEAVRQRGLVIIIQHTDPNEGYARGSDAWQIVPSLLRAPGDLLIEKTACDSFLETELDAELKKRGVTDLIITGCATDFCVDTTVRAAASRGLNVSVASDGHTTSDRPHLTAQQVIAHHNYIWADLLLPRQRRIQVAPTAQLLAAFTSPQA